MKDTIITMNNTNNILIKKGKNKPGTIKEKIVDASYFTKNN